MAKTRLRLYLPILLIWVLGLVLFVSGDAIYFYMDPGQKKCFLEQMPKNTVFMGNFNASIATIPGATAGGNSGLNALRVQVTVESKGEMIMSQQLGANGRFFFTSAIAADHLICLQTVKDSGAGWMSSNQERVKMQFEVFIGDPGETSIVSPVEQKLEGLAAKLKNMNGLLSEIRKEQYNHRSREAEFRDQAEALNSSINYWVLLQLVSMIGLGVWQMHHMRHFFRTKKLV
jgi:hypothetical protein